MKNIFFILSILFFVQISVAMEYTDYDRLCIYDIYYNESCLTNNQSYLINDSMDYYFVLKFDNSTNTSLISLVEEEKYNKKPIIVFIAVCFILFFIFIFCQTFNHF